MRRTVRTSNVTLGGDSPVNRNLKIIAETVYQRLIATHGSLILHTEASPMTPNQKKAIDEITLDIQECEKIGIFSHALARRMLAYMQDNPEEVLEYREGGMSDAEVSDLISQLVRIGN